MEGDGSFSLQSRLSEMAGTSHCTIAFGSHQRPLCRSDWHTCPTSPLLPSSRPGKNMVSVTSKFFQSNPNGISPGSVKQDVLGFLSLVVSYAKRARSTSPPIYSGTSPKSEISIMPRTEFVSLYAQVSGGLPGSDTLYNLVKVLACYKNDGDDVEYVLYRSTTMHY